LVTWRARQGVSGDGFDRIDAVRRDQFPPHRKHSTFVLPNWKLVYVSNPKAACTTIKWMLADLQGIDEQTFYSSLREETTRGTTIHQHRPYWGAGTPRLQALTLEQVAAITPENGWFVFSMVRHPGNRLWSAWQSKLLLREPRLQAQYAGEPWLPRIPETTDDVVEDWERFIRAVAADPKMPIMQDQHFRPQSTLLTVKKTKYDRLYDTSEFDLMAKDIRAHLEAQGWRGELSNRRSNETPLPPIERAFPPHVVDTLATVFEGDFRKLDYDDPMPPRLRSGDYSADLLAAVGIIAERGERIGDLSRAARALEVQARVAERRPKSTLDRVRRALPTSVRRAVPARIRRLARR
jgi:hypothetical protein